MRAAVLTLLLIVIGAGAATAQQPTIAASAVAARAEPLPVLDDDGVVIPEQLIVERMKPRFGNMARFFIRLGFGIVAANFFSNQYRVEGRDCSIYEPCSDRENWQRKSAGWFGFAMGVMLSYAVMDGSVDRMEAVERIRAERRRLRSGAQ